MKALNDNLPFDQFLTWQLAGDLLQDPTLEQLVATGFVRMNPTTAEGGAIPLRILSSRARKGEAIPVSNAEGVRTLSQDAPHTGDSFIAYARPGAHRSRGRRRNDT